MKARARKWGPREIFGVAVYLSILSILVLSAPNLMWDDIGENVVVVFGVFGLWRFGWWANHVMRAWIYGHVAFPKMRRRADEVWECGMRPRHLHFMVTTFRERPEITTQVVRSIIGEVRSSRLSATIWLGSGDAVDEDLYAAIIDEEATDIPLDLVIARQDRPGKRYAIGMALRAMYRAGVDENDIAIFMDGDSIIVQGMIAKCVPLFALDERLGAMTTDEEVVVHGPQWVVTWLAMRFAQRRIAMQSHSLSGKILTLTGRLSLFRARYVVDPSFIDIVEEDHLEHWLWGRFRFLSGDDKSTWFHILRLGLRMIYVPDALCVTIEHIEGGGYTRMVHNLRRWSGNMLRNGARAIALGPRRVGLFTWWCLVDQRIAMWTMLISPVLAISGTMFSSNLFLITYLTWILGTRLCQSCVLWLYSRQVYLGYPVFLYVNQMLNAVVKVYCMFRLSRQRWTNRGDQRAGFGNGFADNVRGGVARYLTGIATGGLVLCVLTYTGLVHAPSMITLQTMIASITEP